MIQTQSIAGTTRRILAGIPISISVLAATKTRTIEEVQAAVDAGIKTIGENYVQEALEKYPSIRGAEKHLIGHLQKNKVKKALSIFDMIQSVDSYEIAAEIDKLTERPYPILIEVNCGSEETKSGVAPEKVEGLIREISTLGKIQVKGLMAIPPYDPDPERSRPHFKMMKGLFDKISREKIANVEMKVLSMGMSHDYLIAISEGSTMVRIGEAIFGPRK